MFVHLLKYKEEKDLRPTEVLNTSPCESCALVSLEIGLENIKVKKSMEIDCFI